MRIHVAHLNCQAGGHDFIMNFCIYFHFFCLETALSIFYLERNPENGRYWFKGPEKGMATVFLWA